MMRDMKPCHAISYDAPPADVFAMLSDAEFRQASAAAKGMDKEQAAGVAWLGGMR